jgi:hypothetical protein
LRSREHRSQRAHCGTARDSENVRIGKRVAQQHLHQCAGESEQRANRERRECTGQAQIAHDRRSCFACVACERMDDRGEPDVDAANRKRTADRDECHRAQRNQDRGATGGAGNSGQR